MTTVYQNIKTLLDQNQISYQEFDHEPILSYEDAEREKARLHWSGIESKNVFMLGNDDNYYIYVTVQGEKVDFKLLKELLGVKLSIASAEDVKTVAECVPGCVSPFGFSEKIIIVVDPKIFTHTDYLFSPGVTTKTVQLNIQDLKPVFEKLPNKVIFLAGPKE